MVTGRLTVTLRASTSAVSTDWTAKLVDVWPDGRAMSVIDGIVRVGAEPDVATEHVIDLVATGQVFKAGHRIRVQISSSNFPRFDRNPGTGRSSADGAEGTGDAVYDRVLASQQHLAMLAQAPMRAAPSHLPVEVGHDRR